MSELLIPQLAMAAFFFFALLSTATLVVAEESDCFKEKSCRSKNAALHLKMVAIASILVASTVGVCIPIAGRTFAALRPERDIFLVVKAFAAGVILATGFVHILPDAFEALTNRCLKNRLWHDFPFAGCIAMMASVCCLLVDAAATGYYQRAHFRKLRHQVGASEMSDRELGNGTEAEADDNGLHGCGHGHNLAADDSESSRLRNRVISQVLELGIVAHSVIIGISLGASESPCTIRPLVAALTFHQFFEGIGLGGSIVQASFKKRSTAVMAFFFSVTTPLGIAVGIAISSAYNENSPAALVVEGLFDSASAGILVYMSLVDFLAPDFLNSRMQRKAALQAWAYSALLLGAGSMSLLARWA